MTYKTLCGDSTQILKQFTEKVDFTFLDPPFNQQKDYALHNDDMPKEKYWAMMKEVCQSVYELSG